MASFPYTYINNSFLSSGGRIGRLRFFINKILIYVLASLISILTTFLLAFIVVNSSHQIYMYLLKLADWIIFLIAIYLLKVNDFKRMRDIYNREVPTLSAIALVIIFTNPLGEIFSWIVLPSIPKNYRSH